MVNRIRLSGATPTILLDNLSDLHGWLDKCVTDRGFTIGSLHYTFGDDEDIQVLNNKLLNHNYPTDIITLNHSRTSRLKVDLYLGVDVIRDNASNLNIDFVDELCRVMIHGLLHCMGEDDNDDEARARMRLAEDNCLLSRPKSLTVSSI